MWAEQIRQLYRDDIDRVDLLVGMYAEPLPPGFAFSDTALRVFILMATRRLNSDRFFTDDFRAEVYTPEGMDWIADNGMRTCAAAPPSGAARGAGRRPQRIRAVGARRPLKSRVTGARVGVSSNRGP